jgi:hypothetical protein
MKITRGYNPSIPAEVIYESGNIMYICKASPGTGLSEAKWQIQKIDIDTPIRSKWANGSISYTNQATDLSTVESITYL